MSLIAIPNVSEGTDGQRIADLRWAASGSGAEVLDTDSDPAHNRTVFTLTGAADALRDSLASLAASADGMIDLTRQEGAHPRVGTLDVCPLVPHEAPMEEAVTTAREVGKRIADELALPVYLYGAAATREEKRALPDIRKGGLASLIARAKQGFVPDLGPQEIDPRRGVVCVGARDVLIAFNVWLRAEAESAASIAREVRQIRGVRALGLAIGPGVSQVSMNLVEPEKTGVEDAFAAVQEHARKIGAEIGGTELIGLIPDRFLPAPDRAAARLLIRPGRSLEERLRLAAG